MKHMSTATRATWISGCEDQINSTIKNWNDWDDAEFVALLQTLVTEWSEATACM